MSSHTETSRDIGALIDILDSGRFNLNLAGNRKEIRDFFRRMSYAAGYEDKRLALELPDVKGMADWYNNNLELLNLQELHVNRKEKLVKQAAVNTESKGIKKSNKQKPSSVKATSEKTRAAKAKKQALD